jgi:alpha-N-arabinofuranosidase
MNSTRNSRRAFLKDVGRAGMAAGVATWLSRMGLAQGNGPARAVIHREHVRATLDRRVFGSFLEHLGRAIYEGIYQPGSPLADARGFRTDVAKIVTDMGVPIVRYPGGNFVSGYNWLDGVGPREGRPTVLERAWNSLETNQFGTNEFMQWCELVGTEPMMACNLGNGTPEMAAALVEYCTVPGGSKWSELRRSHGFDKPWDVTYWCLGNEMDGPWQMGHMPAREYGRKARDAANQIRMIAPQTQLIASGSSNPNMQTYLTWDRELLEECYDMVDGLSLHVYFANSPETTGGSTARFLAMNLDMARQIHQVAAVCDYVQGILASPKRLWLSFDEWNVWYRHFGDEYWNGRRTEAPHLLEEPYNLEDALLIGGCLNTLIRESNRVRIGCLAQLVNAIAPLSTSDTAVLKHTIFYPYNWALQYARGAALDVLVTSETYPIRGEGLRADLAIDAEIPYVDVVVTVDEAAGRATALMLNRDLEGERELTLDWRDLTPSRVLVCETLTGPDVKAGNTFEQPEAIGPQPLDPPTMGSAMTLRLPPRSYSVLHVALG